MEEIREERIDKAETNTSGEGTNIILVIISACILIITVTVAAIFLLHPSKNKERTEDLAYTGDIHNLGGIKTDETHPQVENKTDTTGTEAANPTDNEPGQTVSHTAGEQTGNVSKPGQETNVQAFTYGDPNAVAEADKKLNAIPEVIVEKRYDPKTDLPTGDKIPPGVNAGQGKLQPPVRNTTTAVTNRQELTGKSKTPMEKNTSLAAVQQPRTITVKEYWIQVAAFKSKTRAETLNEKLSQLGYAGTIKTTNFEGETLFRVRLGPYSNNSEAEKFRNWLKDIKGLQDSYISQTIQKKTIN